LLFLKKSIPSIEVFIPNPFAISMPFDSLRLPTNITGSTMRDLLHLINKSVPILPVPIMPTFIFILQLFYFFD
jgi:hypothetical protein